MERMADDNADIDRLAALAPRPAVPASLERRILADFDRIAARWTLGKAVRRPAEAVWPGAPVWQPVCAFAFSLLIGLGVAAFAPLDLAPPDDGGASLFAFDNTPDIGQDI